MPADMFKVIGSAIAISGLGKVDNYTHELTQTRLAASHTCCALICQESKMPCRWKVREEEIINICKQFGEIYSAGFLSRWPFGRRLKVIQKSEPGSLPIIHVDYQVGLAVVVMSTKFSCDSIPALTGEAALRLLRQW